ncbi:MAG: hypothetical protein ACREVJ_07620 [Gammaproteobacteria bacterium]
MRVVIVIALALTGVSCAGERDPIENDYACASVVARVDNLYVADYYAGGDLRESNYLHAALEVERELLKRQNLVPDKALAAALIASQERVREALTEDRTIFGTGAFLSVEIECRRFQEPGLLFSLTR